MASTVITCFTPLFLHLFFLISLFRGTFGGRHLNELVQEQPLSMPYHNGPLLSGNISVNLLWYGTFSPTQKSIIADFVSSLTPSSASPRVQRPSVAAWWETTRKYYRLSANKRASLSLFLGDQTADEKCSLGKSLTGAQLSRLASRGRQSYAVNVVLTAPDVTVEGFCSSRCGTHGSGFSKGAPNGRRSRFAYVWVGNSETQCPGQCAWPFHQPLYGPQTPPLVAPNRDVGVDGMVINLASLLAGTVTNTYGTGFFQGDESAPLEAASACPGIYAKGAYPGYPGNLLVDAVTGGSYNVHGAGGRKYLVPALFDPTTSSCSTAV